MQVSKNLFFKKSRGFTLMELVIVLVIIGILASISVPIYTSYIRKAYAAEGTALCDAVASAEKTYYAENNVYVSVNSGGTTIGTLTVNPETNLYFTSYAVAVTGSVGNTCTFTITTSGAAGSKAAGISITYFGSSAAPATVTVTGL